MFLTAVTFAYFVSTGSLVDLTLLKYVLLHFSDLASIISSEMRGIQVLGRPCLADMKARSKSRMTDQGSKRTSCVDMVAPLFIIPMRTTNNNLSLFHSDRKLRSARGAIPPPGWA